MITFGSKNENQLVRRENWRCGESSRRAIYLTSQGAPIFGWLHRPSGGSGHGIILCPPIGHEQVHTHRSLRHLAERLADAGLCVMRFDYRGTGDSASLDENADGCSAWLANIRDIAAWMREHLRCRHISLMGLRIGASLACQIATEQAVDNLILWEPVVRGRAYVRELKALSSMAGSMPRQLEGSSAGIEAAGSWFGKPVCDALGQLDLLKSRPLCRRALIVSRDDMPSDGRLLQHLAGLGIDSDERALPGYADMLAEPHFTKVPHQAIAETVDWLVSSISAADERTEACHPELQIAQAAVVVDEPTAQRPIREQIVQISQHPDLVGILSEPAQRNENLPLILLANSGSAHRVGPGDLYVKLTRHLVGRGFRCLRLDLSGLGDSVTADASRENDSYPDTGFRDIDLALQFARTELGADRVVLMGLCSGAYFAFQSAAQNPDPALIESVLINPLTFFWREGMSLETCPAEQIAALQYYLGAALQPRNWLKLLSGRTRVGFFGGLKILAQRLGLQRFGREPAALNAETERRLGHPATDDLPGDLDRVAQAGRLLACFFAPSDPGYGILTFSARRKLKQMCRAGKMSVHFIEDADHTFSRRGPRQALIEGIGAYLCRRYFPIA